MEKLTGDRVRLNISVNREDILKLRARQWCEKQSRIIYDVLYDQDQYFITETEADIAKDVGLQAKNPICSINVTQLVGVIRRKKKNQINNYVYQVDFNLLHYYFFHLTQNLIRAQKRKDHEHRICRTVTIFWYLPRNTQFYITEDYYIESPTAREIDRHEGAYMKLNNMIKFYGLNLMASLQRDKNLFILYFGYRFIKKAGTESRNIKAPWNLLFYKTANPTSTHLLIPHFTHTTKHNSYAVPVHLISLLKSKLTNNFTTRFLTFLACVKIKLPKFLCIEILRMVWDSEIRLLFFEDPHFRNGFRPSIEIYMYPYLKVINLPTTVHFQCYLRYSNDKGLYLHFKLKAPACYSDVTHTKYLTQETKKFYDDFVDFEKCIKRKKQQQRHDEHLCIH